MITDFSLLLLVLALTVPLYWALPEKRRPARLAVLSLVSVTLLYLLSPLIFLSVIFYALLYGIFALLIRRQTLPIPRLKAASWLVFLPLAVLEQVPPEIVAKGLLGESVLEMPLLIGFTFLGASYSAIRCFILIRETLQDPMPNLSEALASLLFFGSFMAGPITGAAPYRNSAPTLTRAAGLMGLARLGWGVAMFLVIKPLAEGVDLAALTGATGATLAWLGLYHKFLLLYIDFSGYSDIAIGCALLYGIKLPENFNWPLRATSIQEFWQRWHMSLGAFIGTYLFKPIVRQFGKPWLAIFVAFTAVGIWHAVTLPYLLWGIGHGAALALNMTLRKAVPVKTWPKPLFRINQAFGWVVTMTFVAFLSSFANTTGLTASFQLVQSLF
ncbi:MAG: MBOAT family O-acyltransferase [Pseudomonadota bacterium]